ncbi:hypothetical protein [Pedobacter metabolipauper]|uniref:Uncharacterized protein n=1 Tax=Pedobacter metabolipauper TaxID=425513 RepID=A0A4R6SYT5_9SPHI|nr:hypothetical protein [Pedobacter metabolipauper]TDQ10929.1 hypothetical protein ATK78_0039 [Pedobacter metabolipauper]
MITTQTNENFSCFLLKDYAAVCKSSIMDLNINLGEVNQLMDSIFVKQQLNLDEEMLYYLAISG